MTNVELVQSTPFSAFVLLAVAQREKRPRSVVLVSTRCCGPRKLAHNFFSAMRNGIFCPPRVSLGDLGETLHRCVFDGDMKRARDKLGWIAVQGGLRKATRPPGAPTSPGSSQQARPPRQQARRCGILACRLLAHAAALAAGCLLAAGSAGASGWLLRVRCALLWAPPPGWLAAAAWLLRLRRAASYAWAAVLLASYHLASSTPGRARRALY